MAHRDPADDALAFVLSIDSSLSAQERVDLTAGYLASLRLAQGVVLPVHQGHVRILALERDQASKREAAAAPANTERGKVILSTALADEDESEEERGIRAAEAKRPYSPRISAALRAYLRPKDEREMPSFRQAIYAALYLESPLTPAQIELVLDHNGYRFGKSGNRADVIRATLHHAVRRKDAELRVVERGLYGFTSPQHRTRVGEEIERVLEDRKG